MSEKAADEEISNRNREQKDDNASEGKDSNESWEEEIEDEDDEGMNEDEAFFLVLIKAKCVARVTPSRRTAIIHRSIDCVAE